MREQILSNIENPRFLERLYRSNKTAFKAEFISLYPEVKQHQMSSFWYERLNYESDAISWGTAREKIFLLMAALLAGFLAKLPSFFPINEEFYYTRNAGFIIFPILSAYFLWRNKVSWIKQALLYATFAISLFHINLLPGNSETDTLLLACLHLPLFLWLLLGISFTGNHWRSREKRIEFLRFNGDLLVMAALLVIAGVIMTGVTLGLFEIAGLNIEEFYFRNIVLFFLPSVPILAIYLTQHNPHLVNKVSPLIAKIFSPLVLVMLIIYLFAMAFSGKDPFTDREFLLVFNLLLIGVMALIFFSIAEDPFKRGEAWSTWIILLLSLVTIVVNGIALSAILFRISEWGITPNRFAVLGANILMLIHLLILTGRQIHSIWKNSGKERLERYIAGYFPVYMAWLVVMVFMVPFLF